MFNYPETLTTMEATLAECLMNEEEIAKASVNYKTYTHPELAKAEKHALMRLIDTADAKLNWRGFRNDLLAIRFEKARRAAWTV